MTTTNQQLYGLTELNLGQTDDSSAVKRDQTASVIPRTMTFLNIYLINFHCFIFLLL